MCGIAGIVDFEGRLDARTHIRAMNDRMRLRGPDDEGYWHDELATLAQRRLSIIDLAGGHQPMVLGPTVITFNGEIYNFAEVRQRLIADGATFTTRSDTEVILQAYRRWGADCVRELDGMFAFALWDPTQRRVVLARDRFGKKPLYYCRVGRSLLFASTLTALLAHPATPRELDDDAVAEYLALEYIVAPRTILRGVHKLPAATVATLEADGRWTETRYWRPPPVATYRGTFEEACVELRQRLSAAVEKRLIASDVPVGIFLSGGLDSSTVAALAARNHPQIETFSIAFDDPSYDESHHARRVAEHLGTRHHEERLSLDTALALVSEIGGIWDEPVGDGSVVPTLLLSRFARQRVTVALGGDGGDELFAGYPTYRANRVFGVLRRGLPHLLVAAAQRAARLLPTAHGNFSLDFVVGKVLSGLDQPRDIRNLVWMGALPPRALAQLLGRAVDPYAAARRIYAEATGNHLERVLQQDLALYMCHSVLAKVDRASMAASLEVRAPILDTAVAELALALPLPWKLHGFAGKYILKEVASSLLPHDIVHRSKKGFGMPIAAWLHGPLAAPLRELVLGPRSLATSGYFDGAMLTRMVDEHTRGTANHRQALWSLFVLESWRQKTLGA